MRFTHPTLLKPNDMSVGNLVRITRKPSQVEWFSSISPDGRLILFNHTRFSPRSQAVLVHDRQTQKQHVLLRGAGFPHWYSNTEFQ